MGDTILQKLQQVTVAKPSDLIIDQLRSLIAAGDLKPGQKLPSERELTQHFGVGRGHVREALRRLEMYGIVRTLPQSGTIVAEFGAPALEGLIANLLAFQEPSLEMFTEMRELLETFAACCAAERASSEEIAAIAAAHRKHADVVAAGHFGMEEDIVFHLKVAEASGNKALMSLIGLFATDLIKMSVAHQTCRDGRGSVAVAEHGAVLAAIERHDGAAASQAMRVHVAQSWRQFERQAADRSSAPDSRPTRFEPVLRKTPV
ncbi:GntR family transcriptional regulator [Xanthobacteraceae bacterium Astr-EGSB]|uniref:FadR/GntR family transcriptional regulator n=1 Tax=Astrobacterium formosum TaxID=3069710 RepID=UPI0027B6CE22|nr:GntR family transcriptional regulator [Xanthobacteraceae bacterium Astr-EGSB]